MQMSMSTAEVVTDWRVTRPWNVMKISMFAFFVHCVLSDDWNIVVDKSVIHLVVELLHRMTELQDLLQGTAYVAELSFLQIEKKLYLMQILRSN